MRSTLLLCLTVLPAIAAAEPYLRLEGVPEQLQIPLSEGKNVILTAKVLEGEAKSVWLAHSKDAKVRMMFTKVGPSEYQINLADKDVASVLRSGGTAKQFGVFADTKKAGIIQSVPVNYTLVTQAPGRRATKSYLRVGPEGERRLIQRWSDNWVRVSEVKALEVQTEGKVEGAVKARIGKDQMIPFKGKELAITDDLRTKWQAAGQLVLHHADLSSWRLKAIPDRLDISGNVAKLTILQRRSRQVPGSNGYLCLELGDITAGQVMLTLRTAEREALIDQESTKRGDYYAFTVGDTEYNLYLRQLRNVLLGDDWAAFEVSHLGPEDWRQIERLLDHISASDVVFVREGKEYSGKEAADHLRAKLAAAGPKINAVDEFIDKIASRSSVSGKPYQVRPPDGEAVTANAWLREAAKKMKEAPKDEPAGEEQDGAGGGK